MGKKGLFDRASIADLLAKQDGLITRAQLISCAMSDSALRNRLRAGGSWQLLLPGVYQAFTGVPTQDQRELAALLYAGPGSIITGPAALAAHGIAVPDGPVVDVLIPAGRRRSDYSFVRVQRTARFPAVAYSRGSLHYVPPDRAVADTVRRLSDLTEVRAIVASAVQRRSVQVSDLARELDQGPVRCSASLRAALAETADGIRSVAEADLRRLIVRFGLPAPLYNPRLYLGEEFIACPDAWWPEAGVAVEVDSRQWHLSPKDWERTMARHSKMSALGIIVLHYPPARLSAEPRVVAAQIKSALEAGRGRRLPEFRAEPAR